MKIPLRRAEPDTQATAAPDSRPPTPLYLRLACPNCSAIMTVDLAAGGTPVQCGDCREYLIAPKGRYGPSVVIGDYVLRRHLGSGGMGAVYLAHQLSLDRLCALKILHPSIQANESLVRKLQEEARVAARLNHPHMVQCYAVGYDDDTYYYAMEYVPGKSLGELLDEKHKLTPGVTLDIVRQVAAALDHGWQRQHLVHRDVKPDNILIDENGDAKLADLGIASSEQAGTDRESGNARGTLWYMCPEQAQGLPTDLRGDVFSLGVVTYLCLTGRLPFPGDSPAAAAARLADTEPPAHPQSLDPDLPPELCAVPLKMLAKAPDQRYQDYTSLLADLDGLRLRCPDSKACREKTKLRDTFAAVPAVMPAASAAPAPARRGRPWGWVAGIAILLLVALAGLGAAWLLPHAPGSIVFREGRQGTSGSSAAGSPPLALAGRASPPVPAAADDAGTVVLAAAIPDPDGYDEGHESLRLLNLSSSRTVDLTGWSVRDEAGTLPLAGTIGPGQTLALTIPPGTIHLPNATDKTLELRGPAGITLQTVSYAAADVQPGKEVQFAR